MGWALERWLPKPHWIHQLRRVSARLEALSLYSPRLTCGDNYSARSKKSKKKKSKPPSTKSNGESSKANGAEIDPDQEDDGGEDEVDSPVVSAEEPQADEETSSLPKSEHSSTEKPAEDDTFAPNGLSKDEVSPDTLDSRPTSNRFSGDAEQGPGTATGDRDQLQAEVINLRTSLENIQQKHDGELAEIRSQLQDAQTGKEHAEGRYQKLLGQVNTIKKQLGERLKADAVRLFPEKCCSCII